MLRYMPTLKIVLLTTLTASGNLLLQASPLLAAEGDANLTTQTVRAQNDFAINLYRQLKDAEKESNLFFSPYSIYSALLMTAEGARGETAR